MRLFISILFIHLFLNINAQGIHFSDNREIPMQLNPAFAGVIHNKYVHRLVVAHRRQGNAILGSDEFETSYLSYDRKIGLCQFAEDIFIGIGTELLHDQVGAGISRSSQFFHRQELNLNTSLGIKLSRGSYLIAGLKMGLLSHGLSGNNLSYDNQFDGRDYDPNLPTMEVFSNTRLLYFDIGAGVMLRGTIQDNGRSQLLKVKTYELGMSFMHLNNKRENYLMNSLEEELEKEYRVHSRLDILINKTIITPSFILFKYGAIGSRGKEWQIRPALEFSFLKNWVIGGGARISNFADRGSNLDAVVFNLKWKPYEGIIGNKYRKDSMIIGLSFDMNVSPHLYRASNGYGALELFVVKYFTGNKNRAPCCPWSNTENQAFY